MIFDEFMSFYERKFFIKEFSEKGGLGTSSRHFLIFKKSSAAKKESEMVGADFYRF